MNALWKKYRYAVGTMIGPGILAACGGGGDGPGKCYSPNPAICSAVGVPRSFPETPNSPVGLYRGVTDNGRAAAVLILDDRSVYSLYSAVNNPAIAAGAMQGTIRAEAGKFTITDAVDFSLETGRTQLASVTGTYGEKQFINGSATYPASGQRVSFTANYSADYELIPSLSIIAGTYTGSSASPTGPESVVVEISAAGAVSGRSSTGCTFGGTIQPRESGNAYRVSVTFAATICRLPGATVSGITYFDRDSKMAYTFVSLPAKDDNFIAILTRQ